MSSKVKNLKAVLFSTLLTLTFANSSFAEVLPSPIQPPDGVESATPQDLIDIFQNGGEVYDIRWHYSTYEFGGHIPFARYAPYTEWSSKEDNYNANEDSWDYSLLPKDKNTPVAFTCGGVLCWKSYKLTKEVAARGYKNVYWLREGQAAWDAQNLPVLGRNPVYEPMMKLFGGENEPTTWIIDAKTLKEMFDDNEDIKVIDFRDEALFLKGRLQSAFNVPIQRLLYKDGLQLLPTPKQEYKIVLISDSGTLAATAAAPLAALGYDVKVLEGGMNAWTLKYGKENTVDGELEVNFPDQKDWKRQIPKLPKNR